MCCAGQAAGLETLLATTPVLLYCGTRDITAHLPGLNRLVRSLRWPAHQQFSDMPASRHGSHIQNSSHRPVASIVLYLEKRVRINAFHLYIDRVVSYWVDEQRSGWVRAGGGLSVVAVNGAGAHLALDQPATALSILTEFIQSGQVTGADPDLTRCGS